MSPHDDPTPGDSDLDRIRRAITETDDELIRLIGRRRELVLEIGRVKEALGAPVTDPAREAAVVRRAAQKAREAGVDQELVREVVWRIMASARDEQHNRTRWGPSPLPVDDQSSA